MKYYIDIMIRPDPELKTSMLMGTLFNKLHQILVLLKSNTIAVSFPEYQVTTLGRTLRIHADKCSLQALMGTPWLNGMDNCIRKTKINHIPENTRFISVRRKQNKYANIARLRRRYMKRHQVSEHDAIKAMPDALKKTLSCPYVHIRSSSTQQPSFPFYVAQKEMSAAVLSKDFNCYGLSQTASVPWF